MAKKKRQYGLGESPKKLEHNGVLWDMHCHLDMTVEYIQNIAKDLQIRKPELPQIFIPNLNDLVKLSAESGINGFLHCACDLEKILNISSVLDEIEGFIKAEYQNNNDIKIYGAVAIHPNESALHAGVNEVSPDGLQPQFRDIHKEFNLEDAINQVYRIAKNDARVKVIGETGLDYFRTSQNGVDSQKKSFRKHIEIAKELNKPLQIHDRQAHQDILNILDHDKAPDVVLLHSFSGDQSFAKECAKRGYFASFSGPITFKANDSLREAFKYYYENAPELILIETDCPFLTPEPNRGQPNAPMFIGNTIRFMAQFLGLSETFLANLIVANQSRIFK